MSTNSPEEVVVGIEIQIELAERKVKRFSSSAVTVSMVPMVDGRLKEIRDMQDQIDLAFLGFKRTNTGHESIAGLEKKIDTLGDQIAKNEKAVMDSVAKLCSGGVGCKLISQ